jgi:hypothetical protein
MSITVILAAIGGLISLIAGIFIGRPIFKASGRKEGAEQVKAEQQVEQAKVIVEAVQERNHVEANVAATPRTDIDNELREFSRPD